MSKSPSRFVAELRRLLAPLAGSWRAVIYAAVGLALLLAYLHQGSRDFFTTHLAPGWLPGAGPLEVEWWAVLYQHAAAFLLFLVIPVVLLKVVAKERLAELGLGLGEWKLGFGVYAPLGLLLVALPAGLSAAGMPAFVTEYPLAKAAGASTGQFITYQLAYGLLYYTAYEAFFRGMLQFGLRRHIGDVGAILVQTAVTTLLHIGKPEGEIWSALFAGFLFGALAFRLRSIWPIWLIHWGLGLLTDLACSQAA